MHAPTDSKGKEIRAQYLFELLTRNGSTEGKNAYIELCQMGCDSHILGEALVYLHSEGCLTISHTPEERMQRYRELGYGHLLTESFIEHEKQKGVETLEVYLRPMDSRKGALGQFTTRRLKALRGNCRKLADELESFHATRFISHGVIDGKFPDPYPFRVAHMLRAYADDFLPFVIEKTKEIGPKQRPDYTRLLTKVHNHIKTSIKTWQDGRVAVILNHLFAYPFAELQTAESQKQWRYEHGIVDKRD